MCSLPVVVSQYSMRLCEFFHSDGSFDARLYKCNANTPLPPTIGTNKNFAIHKTQSVFPFVANFFCFSWLDTDPQRCKRTDPNAFRSYSVFALSFFCCSSFMTLLLFFSAFQAFLLFSGSGNFGKRRIRSRQWCIQNDSSDKRSSKSMSWVVFADFLNILWFFPFRFLVSVFGKNQMMNVKFPLMINLENG